MAKATGPVYYVPFKRRRAGLTNYRRRIGLIKSGKPRLVVRKTNTQTIVQFIAYDEKGDRTLAQAASGELKKMGWKGCGSTPAAYLAGLMAGRRAVKAGVKEAVLDLGLTPATPGSKVFAAMQGAADAGVQVPAAKEMVSAERVKGARLGADVQKLFEDSKAMIMKE